MLHRPLVLFAVLLTILVSCTSSSENKKSTTANDSSETEELRDTETSLTSAIETHGQLRVSGNKILDQNDIPVQLRGMSLFWSQWIGKYYNTEAINWLKEDWKCNIVRAAMAVDEDLGYITNPEIEKQKVFAVIDAAIENDIYVIVDWHSHHAENYLEQAQEFFTEVAEKYGDKPNIIYEIYNEPLDVSWDEVLKPYHTEVIQSIRMYDPDNIIVCGTRNWSQRVDEVIGNEIEDSNIAYTLHYYAATHKAELREIAQQAINNGLALFVTEYGVSEASGDGSIDQAEANRWWQFLDDNKISWCNWSIADKQELSAALKPNAAANGNWPIEELTTSGAMVREEIKSKNPEYN